MVDIANRIFTDGAKFRCDAEMLSPFRIALDCVVS